MLQNKNPFKKTCGRDDCKLCEYAVNSGSGNSMCSVNNVTYQAKCINCENEGKSRTYDGETARTAYIRSKEHYDDLRRGNKCCWMFKHIEKEHAGNVESVAFSWKVTKKLKKPMQRQLYEAVKISRIGSSHR